MATTSNISVQMDNTLRQEAEEVLATFGLTGSQAINIFYKQITIENRLPFTIKIPEKCFNQTTHLAMKEKNLDTFETPEELYKDLGI